ncbi:MAG: sodium:proton antiporter [bacterium]|nr:sodium:proton antiporter [bacterium]
MNQPTEDKMSSQLSLTIPEREAHNSGGRLSGLNWMALVGAAVVLAYLIYHSLSGGQAPPPDDGHHGPPDGYRPPPLWACLPFAGLLLSIAILPLIRATEHWWESNKNRLAVALGFAALALLFYMFVHPLTYNHTTHEIYATGAARVVHVLEHAILAEYIPFIVLLFSLYVISGGISLRGDLIAKPRTNVAFLAVGAALASFIGTTGASMLLIRPLLQTNAERRNVKHTVIFFIFLVSNIGGCLLPIGDPPLFLGYLMGVPFLWTFKLFVPWVVTCVLLLGVYFVWDTIAFKNEKEIDLIKDRLVREKLSLRGKVNLLYLGGVVLCVALVKPGEPFPLLGFTTFPFLRELLMFALVLASLKSTAPQIRKDNQFNYHAIIEVAVLFVGIFIAMQVPIEILTAKGAALGLSKPWQFFWATGTLSAFLDNAPTYVVFFTTAEAMAHGGGSGILELIGGQFIGEALLVGISLGAVFMGAMSYIGNGPNFMVKSIAEQGGVKMPSFFGYMIYSCIILLPLFAVITLLFVH